MQTFYFSKGSSALAAHIALEEIGLPYEAVEVSIKDGAHQQETYLAINPKGRVPALVDGDTTVTENPAILTYLAECHPEARLLPENPAARARVNEVAAYLCATVHVAFAHKQRGARWADAKSAIEAMQEKVQQNIADAARLIEKHYIRGPWVLGASYSIADPYMFLMHRWMAACDLTADGYPSLAAHKKAMLERPAVIRAMDAHGL